LLDQLLDLTATQRLPNHLAQKCLKVSQAMAPDDFRQRDLMLGVEITLHLLILQIIHRQGHHRKPALDGFEAVLPELA
jgi:hypothetical protein